MATTLRVFHSTAYRYDRPVRFGPHRLLVRPRDGHDLRLLESAIFINPPATLRWNFDTFSNSVAMAHFDEPSDVLEVRSELLIRRYAHEPVLLSEGRRRIPYPFDYDSEDRIDLAPYIAIEHPHEILALQKWLDGVFRDRPDDVVAFLQKLSETIHASFSYTRRDEIGTQSALTTIQKMSGTCRDFAFLFMEAARSYGFAARFVTGYLHDPGHRESALTGGGSTHAWADIFVPGEGWVEFDPTNSITGSASLIRVAVTRTPAQATPISGTYQGGGAAFLGMSVNVEVLEH